MMTLVFIFSFLGFGFQLMLEEEMIFAWYRNLLKHFASKGKWQTYISKPLGLCITCNTTWIGILGAFFIFDRGAFVSIIIGGASAGLATLIKISHVYIKNHLDP